MLPIHRRRWHGCLLAASGAHIFIFAERHLERRDQRLFVRAEALAICHVAYIGAEFAVGPQKIADGGEHFFNLIVLLDQISNIAGRARRGNIVQRLRRLRVKAHARHILRKHGYEGQTESLIKICDELVARHLLELTVIGGARLVRQMPIHVAGIPPTVLLALPEEPRLTNATDFMSARGDAFGAILPHQFTQSVDEFGLRIVEQFVVQAETEGHGNWIGVRASAVVTVRRRNRSACSS